MYANVGSFSAAGARLLAVDTKAAVVFVLVRCQALCRCGYVGCRHCASICCLLLCLPCVFSNVVFRVTLSFCVVSVMVCYRLSCLSLNSSGTSLCPAAEVTIGVVVKALL